MGELLTLNSEGRLSLRSDGGTEMEVRTSRPNVLLLVDTSGSMEGDKLQQAKVGAAEFAGSAMAKGYAVALAIFAERAAMVCDPKEEVAAFERKIAGVRTEMVGKGTDLAAGLVLANKFADLHTVVVVTDGQTEHAPALVAADVLKARGVQILCIGTDDADRDLLRKLATAADLAKYVPSRRLRAAIVDASRMLGA